MELVQQRRNRVQAQRSAFDEKISALGMTVVRKGDARLPEPERTPVRCCYGLDGGRPRTRGELAAAAGGRRSGSRGPWRGRSRDC